MYYVSGACVCERIDTKVASQDRSSVVALPKYGDEALSTRTMCRFSSSIRNDIRLLAHCCIFRLQRSHRHYADRLCVLIQYNILNCSLSINSLLHLDSVLHIRKQLHAGISRVSLGLSQQRAGT
eukprot:scaffold1206_cov388-Prasinococcus_capsulatus_cf.AAC.25